MIMTVNQMLNMSLKDLKKQYTKLRSKMSKRATRLTAKGFRTNFSNWVLSEGGKIPTLTSIYQRTTGAGKTEEFEKQYIVYYYKELQRFDTEESLTSYQEIQKQEMISNFRSAGYDIDESDYFDFIDFLEYVHAADLDMILYTETYEESPSAERSARRERTSEEVKNVMNLFKIYQENGGALPEEILLQRMK